MIYNDLEQLKQALPSKGRMIGLDVGTKTIGVAICDDTWFIASPKLTIGRKGEKTDFPLIQKIIEENKIAAIVIGLPLNMDGSESDMSKFVIKFSENLDKFLNNSKIVFFDERLSSFEAKEMMHQAQTKKHRRDQVIDQIAASVILQGAIDLMASK